MSLSAYLLAEEEPGTGEPGAGLPRRQALRRIISIEEDPLPQLLEGGFEKPLSKCPEEEEVFDQGAEGQSMAAPALELTPTSPRVQPVGKEALYKVRVQAMLLRSAPFSLSPGAPKGYPGGQLQWARAFTIFCVPKVTFPSLYLLS